jgi:Na+/proline symporter
MAAVIYAPAVAILGAAGLDPQYFWHIILLIGITSTVYSAFVGLRGIMAADALQMLIILGGCIITVGYILFNVPTSFGDSVALLKERGTLRVFDFSTDMSISVTTWSVLIAGVLNNGSMYYGDQMSLQRYMSSSSIKDVRRSFLINCVAVTIVFFFLCAIGLSLSLWACHQDPNLLPSDTDRLFPYFISSQLPAGLAGLIISALLAATISSITSGINSLSSAIQLDLSARLLNQRSEAFKLVTARSLSLLIGLAATFLAGFLSHIGQIFDIVQKIVGLFAAPLATTMIFAVLPVKISGRFVVAGLISGCLAGAACTISSSLNTIWAWFPIIGSMWTGTVAMAVTIAILLVGIVKEKRAGVK